MSTIGTIILDDDFVTEYKEHLIGSFNDKLNYFLPVDENSFIGTRIEPSTGDERPINEIFNTHELQYDTTVAYLEILQPTTKLKQLYDLVTMLGEDSTIVYRKTDLKAVVGFFSRVHQLLKAAPPTTDMPDLLTCTVILRDDEALVLQPSDSLRQYIQSFAGYPLGTNKTVDRLLKDLIVKRLDTFILTSTIGYRVARNMSSLYVNHYIDHCEYLDDTTAVVDYPIEGDYKLIKKISLLPVVTDSQLANLLGVQSTHTLRILAVPGLSFAWTPDGTTVLRCWKEQLSIKVAFLTTSPTIRCVSIMPKMSYYLPYEGANNE